MTNHYFKNNPGLHSEEKTINAVMRGRNMSFISDHGVFARNEVDFGTRLLVDAFTWPEQDGDILDMGCGYGAVGICLARETTRTVWMADVNERALGLAERNAEAERLHNIIVLKSDLFSSVEKTNFSSIVTNPPIRAGKQTVHKLFEKAYDHLASGGSFWTVVQKKQGAPSAKEKLMSMFPRVDVVTKQKGYYIFCAKKN
ncbi:class I SAM-dependent methyltransferase [Salibacterium sp. K-3]